MVKVIKKGNVPTARILCRNCKSVLEYSNADLREKFNFESSSYSVPSYANKKYTLTCPVCNVEVDANWIVKPIEITEEQFNNLSDEQKALFD